MEFSVKLSLLIGVLFYAFLVFTFLKKEKLDLKYSLLWIFFIAVMLIMIIFPQVVYFISSLFGIKTPVNTVFILVILFMLIILLSLTSITSIQARNLKSMAQDLALLEYRVRLMEKESED
jgi:hypothetical protein